MGHFEVSKFSLHTNNIMTKSQDSNNITIIVICYLLLQSCILVGWGVSCILLQLL